MSRSRGEGGFVLVLVLAMLVVIGVLAGAIAAVRSVRSPVTRRSPASTVSRRHWDGEHLSGIPFALVVHHSTFPRVSIPRSYG